MTRPTGKPPGRPRATKPLSRAVIVKFTDDDYADLALLAQQTQEPIARLVRTAAINMATTRLAPYKRKQAELASHAHRHRSTPPQPPPSNQVRSSPQSEALPTQRAKRKSAPHSKTIAGLFQPKNSQTT
jgi:hypothetical protein